MSLRYCLRAVTGNTQKCSTPDKPPTLARDSRVSATAIDIAQKKHSLPVTSHNNMTATPSTSIMGARLAEGNSAVTPKESSSPNHQFTCHHHTSTQGCPHRKANRDRNPFIYRYHAVGSWETMWKFPRNPPHFPPLRTEPTWNRCCDGKARESVSL